MNQHEPPLSQNVAIGILDRVASDNIPAHYDDDVAVVTLLLSAENHVSLAVIVARSLFVERYNV